MGKRLLIVVGFLVLTVIFAEIISLLQLRASLTSYAAYWQEQKTEQGEITYLALGDSAAQGLGASKPENSYVGLIADRLREKTGKTVRVVNLSKSGAKIQDVIDNQIPLIDKYGADFITLDIGGNDVVSFNEQQFRTEFNELATLLPEKTVVSNVPYFGGRIKRANEVDKANVIVENATEANDLRLADLYSVTKSRDSIFGYAADFFHPNDRGYRNWADAFWNVLKQL